MNPGLRTSASGMIAQQKMVDVIANNLANVNTTGFKRSKASFEDVLYETVQGPRGGGEGAIGAMQVGHGVRVAAINRVHSQGGPETTGRPLDLAIDGEGFFQVQLPDGGTAYTRDGTFTLSEGGQLVTNNGLAVLPNIIIPPDATTITISNDGTVSVLNGKDTQATIEVGRIELARFANNTGLMALGGNLYRETVASGEAHTGLPQEDGFGKLLQGTLESSNVEVVQEMTDMIAAQRAYEINARAIRAGEDMMTSVNDLLR